MEKFAEGLLAATGALPVEEVEEVEEGTESEEGADTDTDD